jgi:hypothetical protein
VVAPTRIAAKLDEILLRTLPHTLLEPADLRAVSKYLGSNAFRGYKEAHFRAALAWVEHWERLLRFPNPSDAIGKLHAKRLRTGIDRRRNGTVRRVVMHLADSVSRTRANLNKTVPSHSERPKRILGSPGKRLDINEKVAVDRVSVELARQELHDRHMAMLPGIVAKFCYFADSYAPQERRFSDLSLAARYGDAATNIVQQEAFFETIAEFLNTPMTDLIGEYLSDDRATAWMSPRVAASCVAILPRPIALLTSARTEAFLRAST